MMKAFLGVAVFSAALCAKESIAFETLLQALEKNNTKLQTEQIQTKIAQEGLRTAEAAYYPTLSLGATSEYSYKYNTGYTPSYVGSDSLTQSTQYQNSSTVALNYDLFRFGATEQNVKAARAQIKASSAKACMVLKEQLESLLELYSKTRIAQLKLEYYTKIQQRYQEAYVLSKRLFDARELSQSDVFGYAQSIADTIVSVTQLQEEYAGLLLQMTYLTGVDLNPKATFMPLNLDHLSVKQETTFEESAQGKQAYALIEQKEAQLQIEKKRYLPVVSLYGKYDFYGYNKESYASAMDDTDKNGYRVGLAMSWNLFDGFAREAAVETRLLELQQAKIALVDAKRTFEKEQSLLKSQMSERVSRLEKAKQSEDYALQIALMSQLLHENGEADKLTTLKNLIRTYQGAMNASEAEELLVLNQTKTTFLRQKENECAVH